MLWFIYALRDPITWERRYVGKTGDLQRRLSDHTCQTPRLQTHTGRWLAKILRHGMRPLMETLQTGDGDEECDEAERTWIAKLRRSGAPLTNARAGGRGSPTSEEARRRISEAVKGLPKSPETRAKISAAKMGKPRPRHVVEAHRQKMLGHPVSQETRNKIRARRMGHSVSEETRAKIAQTLSGSKLSDETRAKLRISQTARRQRERQQKEI